MKIDELRETFEYLQNCSFHIKENLARFLVIGSVHVKVNLRNSQNEIVFDRLWYPLPCLSYCSPPEERSS